MEFALPGVRGYSIYWYDTSSGAQNWQFGNFWGFQRKININLENGIFY